MLFRLLLVLLKVLLLLVMDLPKLLGPRLQDAELLLNRVNLLKRSGELGPPEALHLLEGFNEGGELTGPGLTEGSFKLQL